MSDEVEMLAFARKAEEQLPRLLVELTDIYKREPQYGRTLAPILAILFKLATDKGIDVEARITE